MNFQMKQSINQAVILTCFFFELFSKSAANDVRYVPVNINQINI